MSNIITLTNNNNDNGCGQCCPFFMLQVKTFFNQFNVVEIKLIKIRGVGFSEICSSAASICWSPELHNFRALTYTVFLIHNGGWVPLFSPSSFYLKAGISSSKLSPPALLFGLPPLNLPKALSLAPLPQFWITSSLPLSAVCLPLQRTLNESFV